MILPSPGHADSVGELEFSEFYASMLVRASSRRERSALILATYNQWATERGAQLMSFRRLRRLLVARGHRHFYSNGAWYGAISIRRVDDDPPPNAQRGRQEPARVQELVDRIDAIARELIALRLELALVLQ